MSATSTSIGDLVSAGALEFGDGYRTRRSEHGRPGFRIIRVADVFDNEVHFDGPDFVSHTQANAIGSKVGKTGDILLTTKGTVGRVAVLPPTEEAVVYSPQLCYFRVLDHARVKPRFLRYWFSSHEFWDQASYRMNNTDMAAYINMADIRSLKISLPRPSVQQGIAEVLGALDDKIAVNTSLSSTCIKLAEAKYQRLLTTPTSHVTLRDILRLEYGKSLAATKRIAGHVDVYGSGGIVGTHNEPLLSGPGVIVGRKGTAGSVHWAPKAYYPIDTTYYVVPADQNASLAFCFFLLKSLRLNEMNSDSAVPGLNREEALSTQVRMPSAPEIRTFTLSVERQFSLVDQLGRESNTLMKIRDTLLPKLMSGKLRVKDAEALVESVV